MLGFLHLPTTLVCSQGRRAIRRIRPVWGETVRDTGVHTLSLGHTQHRLGLRWFLVDTMISGRKVTQEVLIADWTCWRAELALRRSPKFLARSDTQGGEGPAGKTQITVNHSLSGTLR